jgi:hypothetical protein
LDTNNHPEPVNSNVEKKEAPMSRWPTIATMRSFLEEAQAAGRGTTRLTKLKISGFFLNEGRYAGVSTYRSPRLGIIVLLIAESNEINTCFGRFDKIRAFDYSGFRVRLLNFGQSTCSLIAQNDFGPGQVQARADVLRNPTDVLIRKFPGLFGHPLTD